VVSAVLSGWRPWGTALLSISLLTIRILKRHPSIPLIDICCVNII
jgi:hypothetical protein